MPLSLPDNIAVDLRQPVAGDSFNWEALEPAAAKKSIVIHATASEDIHEDGFTVADYHVNHNGWGGVGVHGCVTKDAYPGRPGVTNPGAQLQYVGDLLTWRAGTLNQNPGRIHIEISGLFTPGHGVPSEGQLRAVRAFIDYALAPNNVLPSLNYYNQVTYHNAVPDQNTECPGWQHPQFAEWFGYLQGGAEPSWWNPPAPTPPPQPTPEVPTPVPVTVIPDYQSSWTPGLATLTVTQPGAVAINAETGEVLTNTAPYLGVGTVVQSGGTYRHAGGDFVRTLWSTNNNKWNGIESTFFVTPSTSTPVPVTAVPSAPDPSKLSVFELIRELIAQIVAKLLRKRA